MSKTYQHRGYRVIIGEDGAILVRGGDSLSKYSMAIHHDFQHLAEYGRRNGNGNLQPVADINRIYAGETLYHLPTAGQGGGVSPGVPTAPSGSKLTEEEIRILLEEMRQRYNLTGDQLETLRNALMIGNFTLKGGQLVFIGAEVAQVISASTALAAGTGLGVMGALLVPISGVIGLTLARNYGIRQAALRGVAYATTAWSFHQPSPPFPPLLESMLRKSVPADLPYYRQSWRDSAIEARRGLVSFCRQQNVQEDSVKLFYRAHGGNVDFILARRLMKRLAMQAYSRKYDRDSFLTPAPGYPRQ